MRPNEAAAHGAATLDKPGERRRVSRSTAAAACISARRPGTGVRAHGAGDACAVVGPLDRAQLQGCGRACYSFLPFPSSPSGLPMKASALLQKARDLESRGQLTEAIASYQKVLAREPSNIDALILLGRAQLQQGQFEASAKALRRVVKLRPQHGPAQLLLGIVLGRSGQPQEALACFERAVAADPTADTPLLYKADALATLGRNAEAAAVFEQALAIDPANVVAWNNRGLALEALGRDAEAAESFQRALSLHPNTAEIHFSLGNVLHRLGRHEEAAEHYRRTLALWPNFVRAHANLGSALFKLERWDDALQSLRQAVRLQPDANRPDVAKIHETIAFALQHLLRDQDSLDSFDTALSIDPGNTGIMSSKAGALYALGRIDDARELIEKAIGLQSRDIALYTRLSQMKRFAADDPVIAAMEALLPDLDAQPAAQQANLHFALGKAYNDSGDADRAFPHFAAGNALVRRRIDYDESAEHAGMARIAEVFTPALMQSKAGQGDPSDRPIFVIGMPRSGTTLIEQILASHPRVFGAGEQKKFEDALTALVQPGQPGYPAMIPPTTAAQIKALGADYLSRMSALVPHDRRFTDKLPANSNYVGAIHLALPKARIVQVRRDPLDTCLSIFSINFTDPPAFAYDLGELGRYYRAYERLMDHWRQVLPEGVMLDVQYEDVVDDIEGQARRMLAFCGLPWDDACLAFHRQEGTVRTASAYQVRQPIYRQSLGRWRAYEKHLGPLLEALELKPESLAG
jgi:tetratricopeptide (TPR) repeat protein